MLVHGFHARIRRVVRGHSVPVRISWIEYADDGGVDSTTGRDTGTRTERSVDTAGAFVLVTAENRVVHFTSMNVGDATLDLDDTGLDLASKGPLIFEVFDRAGNSAGKFAQKRNQDGSLPVVPDALLGAGQTVRSFNLEPLR